MKYHPSPLQEDGACGELGIFEIKPQSGVYSNEVVIPCRQALSIFFVYKESNRVFTVPSDYRRDVLRYGEDSPVDDERPILVSGINEKIDATAHKKWAADSSYRPRNFAEAGRQELQVAGAVSPAS